MSLRGLLALLGLTACVPATGGWQSILKPPLRAFQPQQPKRIELPNGMIVFLQEDHELPLVHGMARIRGGSREEPAEKTGLVSLFGDVWRTGGTREKTGDELDDFLEARAAKVETSDDTDSTWMTWSCLKGDLDEVLQVFIDLLRQPAFREDKVALAKTQLRTGIARRNDSISEIASREADKLVYGPTSPYARVPEYKTVDAVTRQDLVDWHATYVHPDRILLGVVGDFDASAFEARLRQAFGDWPRGPKLPSRPVPIAEPPPGYYLVTKEDVNQSVIRMVHLGIVRNNPDFYAVQVMNEIFGGGMGSRLFASLRTKSGLAYAVGGGVGAEYDHPGVARLAIGTKSRTTARAIEGLLAELAELQRSPPSPDELQRGKDSLLNSFIFRFDTKGKVLRARLTFEFYGYPPDLLDRYQPGIARVTAEDVLRVASTYFKRKELRILVVGKPADFDRPLSSFGPVQTIDIRIPPP